MKNRNYTASPLALGIAAAIALSVQSHAVLFQDIAPGELVFKLTNFDEGALYVPQPVGTQVSGVANLDAITAVQASNRIGSEDTWGIAIVQQIFSASDPVTPLWDAGVDGQQLTIMFYGGTDFNLLQNASGVLGPSTTIDSFGLQVDMYLQNLSDPGFTNFNQTGGPAARTGLFSYPTVTDGIHVLSTRTTAGFLRGAGDLGGTATELETVFNGDALLGAGSGSGFLSVAPTAAGVGTLNAQYDSDAFIAPHIPGNTADFQIQFTTTTNGSGDWLVSSNDPIRTTLLPPTTVPEPATGLAAIGCLFATCLKRRRQSS